MDPSWHNVHPHRPAPAMPPGSGPPLPPTHGPICPVCSIYHYPFCPPPFPQNYHPSYAHQHPLPHPDQFYPRHPRHPPPAPIPPSPPIPPTAAYDPFVDHLGGTVGDPHRPFLDSQGPRWSYNPGLNRDPRGVSCANANYGNVGAKRMRFDDPGFSSSSAGKYAKEHFVNPSADDERRLKLIRDHGGATIGEFDMNSGDKRSFDEFSDARYKPNIGLPTKCSFEEGKFGQSHNSLQRDSQLDYGLHQTNVQEHSRLSFNCVEQPRKDNEATRNDWHGVSGANAVRNDRISGFDKELHGPESHFVKKNVMQHVREPKNQYGLPCLNNQQPPLPISPPPPLPLESPGQYLSDPVFSSSPSVSSASLFPILPKSSSAGASRYPPVPEYHSHNRHLDASSGFEELQAFQQAPYKAYFAGNEVVAQRPLSPDKPQIVDASHIIKHPHRANRPDHIVIILRGLPGSGKSYLVKLLRDLEVENGGNVPRIYSIDDYFMTEVEKVEENEVSKTSGTFRGKKAATKKVMEYSYEPEMEEAYRSSMLKAFKRTLDDGGFNFIIVDDRNLRVADFAQFWATAKRAGYEVYLLEATYKDPAGCAARNVHGFILDDIQKMADLWEEAPSLYLKLDIKSLLHGDCLEGNGIQEVDMDMEDEDPAGGHSSTQENHVKKLVVLPVGGLDSDGSLKKDEKWEAEADHPPEEVKELGKSKWSNDLDEDDIHKNEANKKLTAVPRLLHSHNKEGKSVRWGDQVHNSGFSIAAARTVNVASLVIGPGAGYNMKSNPVSDEDKISSSRNAGLTRKHNVFQEQLRAERESFKAVFDKRRQRISGLGDDD